MSALNYTYRDTACLQLAAHWKCQDAKAVAAVELKLLQQRTATSQDATRAKE